MADRIAVMNDGRIQQVDSAYNLYHRPANRFVADFIGQGVLVDATVLAPQRLGTRDRRGRLRRADPPRRQRRAVRRPASASACCCGRTTSSTTTPARCKALVRAKAFRGAEILYTLRLASGAPVLALVPSHHNHAIDEPIGIRLELDHVIAFAPAAGRRPPARRRSPAR